MFGREFDYGRVRAVFMFRREFDSGCVRAVFMSGREFVSGRVHAVFISGRYLSPDGLAPDASRRCVFGLCLYPDMSGQCLSPGGIYSLTGRKWI